MSFAAQDLFDAYDSNEVATDIRLKGKIIEISGRIQSINKNAFDSITLFMMRGIAVSEIESNSRSLLAFRGVSNADVKSKSCQLAPVVVERSGENPTNLCVAGSIGRIAQAQVADEFATKLMPLVQAIRNAGSLSLAEIASALNGRGVRPARGQQVAPVVR